MNHSFNLIMLVLILFTACEEYEAPSPKTNSDLEAIRTITADFQTEPINAEMHDDSADDPAIFVNKAQPDSSLIIVTNKKWGLLVYSLDGRERFRKECGRVNNVDLRQNLQIGAWQGHLVASSNRSGNLISLHQLHEDGRLKSLGDIQTTLNEVYGFCLGNYGGQVYAYINDKDGRIQEYVFSEKDQKLQATLSRSFSVPTQPEGMVVDDTYKRLFVGEEGNGIWTFDLSQDNTNQGYLLPNTTSESNPFIQYDIEGLSIYAPNDSSGYLLVSSQGSYSYALFDRLPPYTFRKAFKISASEDIDAVEETDGLDVTAFYLGESFPKGIAVMQDGFNFEGDKKLSQNVKIIDWRKIQSLIDGSR